MELPNRRHPSVTLADGIKLSFGSNKSGNAMAWQDNCLLIESLAGTNISKNYALRWAQYTVRFHKNDGGNPEATTDQSFTYTEQKALTANAFIREDYVLSGWSTTADGEVAYSDVQSVQNLTATDGAVFHLYAQWRHEGGSCGDYAHWSYDDNGTLSITGTGDINGFGKDNQPWKQYKNDITTLYIGDGITTIFL